MTETEVNSVTKFGMCHERLIEIVPVVWVLLTCEQAQGHLKM
jgi:hypothetical protein